jgi:acetyl-CoA synthetase
VIGQSDEDTGQAICAFVTLGGTLEGTDELVEEIRAHVGERIGKFARPMRARARDRGRLAPRRQAATMGA